MEVPDAQLPIQLPASVPKKAIEDCTWAPPPNWEDHDGVPGFWTQSGPGPAVVAFQGMNQQRDLSLSFA